MKLKKLLLLPLLFTLSSCDFSFDFVKDIFSGGSKEEGALTFDNEKVEKATTIPKRKKEALKKNTKNTFGRSWSKSYNDGTKPSLDEIFALKNESIFESEFYASFNEKHIEERIIEEVKGTNYALQFIVDYKDGKYQWSGAYADMLDNIIKTAEEQGVTFSVDKDKYGENLLKVCEQEMYFADSIDHYLNTIFESMNEFFDSLPASGLTKSINQILFDGLKTNMVIIQNSSRGNFVLDIANPFNIFETKSSSEYYSYNSGFAVDTFRLIFKDYLLDSGALICETYHTTTVMDETTTSSSYIAGYYEYEYNVDPSSAFSNSFKVLTSEEYKALSN